MPTSQFLRMNRGRLGGVAWRAAARFADGWQRRSIDAVRAMRAGGIAPVREQLLSIPLLSVLGRRASVSGHITVVTAGSPADCGWPGAYRRQSGVAENRQWPILAGRQMGQHLFGGFRQEPRDPEIGRAHV